MENQEEITESEKMGLPVFTKEDLLKPRTMVKQDFPILVGDKKGVIRYRLIQSISEHESVSNDIETLIGMSRLIRPGVPVPPACVCFGGKTRIRSEIMAAAYIAKYSVEPEFSLTEAFQVVDAIGPVAKMFPQRVMEDSGFTVELMRYKEEELEKNPFQEDANGSLLGVSAQASGGSESDAGTDNGDCSV